MENVDKTTVKQLKETPEQRKERLAKIGFKKGVSGNINGRPKGSISIKDKIRNHLENHPEEVEDIVKHFVHENRELMWQMLEGRPGTKVDLTTQETPYDNLTKQQRIDKLQQAIKYLNEEEVGTSV